MKRLAILHPVLFLADMFKNKIAAHYPDLQSFHVVDESLLPELKIGRNYTPGGRPSSGRSGLLGTRCGS